MLRKDYLRRMLNFEQQGERNELADRSMPFFKFHKTQVTYVRETHRQMEIGVAC
jgi:hypothetical protein